MKTWITSDLHFSHKSISSFCPSTRGHWDSRNDPQKMDRDMIQMWNAEVSPEDTVYILGDVAFCSPQDATAILKQLNGKLILIEGNHDNANLRDRGFRACFKEVHNYLRMNWNGHTIIMFHYPIYEWDKMHRGSIHFHGHLHQNKTGYEEFRIRNVGFDYTGKIVTLMDDAVADALTGKIKPHHGD